ncbi:MAG: DNA polymerase [Pelovirga sp.]
MLQVHDELVFEAPPGEVAAVCALIRHEMEHAVPLDLPLQVELGKGDNWAEAH